MSLHDRRLVVVGVNSANPDKQLIHADFKTDSQRFKSIDAGALLLTENPGEISLV